MGSVTTVNRSKASFAFQDVWMQLSDRQGLLPVVSADNLVKFNDFLPALVLVEIEFKEKRLPVEFAGSHIRDLLGFELTGLNFLDFNLPVNEEENWKLRRSYHKHPCGRYEELEIKFKDDKNFLCALTSLPFWSRDCRAKLMTFVEVLNSTINPPFEPGRISGAIEVLELIDVGAGVPSD